MRAMPLTKTTTKQEVLSLTIFGHLLRVQGTLTVHGTSILVAATDSTTLNPVVHMYVVLEPDSNLTF